MFMSEKVALYFGALLHDVGKVVYRGSSAQGTHSKLGAEFLSDIANQNPAFDSDAGKAVIEQVRYHHAKEMRNNPALHDGSLAYITYYADNISAGMDRKNEGDESDGAVFDRHVKLRKIFNIVNGHHDDSTIDHEDYNVIREQLRKNLSITTISFDELNSLLNLLEATTSSVPSSTNISELVDVSLYDHARTTAGIAACLYDYCAAHQINNYREAFFDQIASAVGWQENMFLLYSCDMSGIQDFIYGISGSGALKQLRARSFYLEILLEHIIDELLSRLDLCRANLLYSGGGHAYLLLPNTDVVKSRLQEFASDISAWFIENHTTDLYLASAWIECSAADLANDGGDKQRYPELYRKLSERISAVKASRYDAETIRSLNFGARGNRVHDRECTECRRSDVSLDANDRCPLCASLAAISKHLICNDVFAIVDTNDDEDIGQRPHLNMPGDCALIAMTRDEYLTKRPKIRRLYTKNTWDMGIGLATHVWMGDYTSDADDENRFDTYAGNGTTLGQGKGVKRLGVLRADVDDLGSTFAWGIPVEKVSISRSATLSRALEYFFKHKINNILAAGSYRLQVIYSGGDDLFVVGNWSDVIHAAIDIRQAFDEFTGNGSITLSAGVGMFAPKFPIARMASETGNLEDVAKGHRSKDAKKIEKNAIALWTDDAVFGWGEFGEVSRRRELLANAFSGSDKGTAFIYRIIELLRNYDDAVSAPRLAYLLARSFEGDSKKEDIAGQDGAFAKTIYEWSADKNERKKVICALEWYVCGSRERG